jgi:hypothetical protein
VIEDACRGIDFEGSSVAASYRSFESLEIPCVLEKDLARLHA